MSTLSLIVLFSVLYLIIGIVVGFATRSFWKGLFWIVYILEPLGDILGDIDFD